MLLCVGILCLDQLKNRLLMPKSGSKFIKALSQLVIVISKAFTEKVKILSQKNSHFTPLLNIIIYKQQPAWL